MVSLGVSGGGWTYDVFAPDEDDPLIEPFASFVSLWRAKRGGKRFPAWQDFDILDFSDWWGWLAIRDIVPAESLTFEYRLWGTLVTDLYGVDMTGRTVSRAEDTETSLSVGLAEEDYVFYQKIIEDGLIGLMCGEQHWRGHRHVRYGALCVPLADDGKAVDKILSAAHPFEPLLG